MRWVAWRKVMKLVPRQGKQPARPSNCRLKICPGQDGRSLDLYPVLSSDLADPRWATCVNTTEKALHPHALSIVRGAIEGVEEDTVEKERVK